MWPPVGGRDLLDDLDVSAQQLEPAPDGSWQLPDHPTALVQSPSGSVFDTVEEGRVALVAWARRHNALSQFFSPERCIVLHEDGAGGWRLWQVVHRLEPLSESLADALTARDPDRCADLLSLAAQALAKLHPIPLLAGVSLTPDSVGVDDLEPCYAGLLSWPMDLDCADDRGDGAWIEEAEEHEDQFNQELVQVLTQGLIPWPSGAFHITRALSKRPMGARMMPLVRQPPDP